MILHGVVDRQTRDLDFFVADPNVVKDAASAFEQALRDADMEVARRVDAPGFVRLEVSLNGETCEVDLGNDFRLRPEVSGDFGHMLDLEELAADKTLALYGRAAARDFIDVYFLAQRFGEDRLCALAYEKDRGFHEKHLEDALHAFGRLDKEMFGVDDATFRAVRLWTISWRERLIERSLREHGIEA